jgi:putative flippase GtrA
MESCYKVFRREAIQGIEIRENRFGFEPEIVAKIAHRRLRIYEMAISYAGRTYEEGKKITWKDGARALYCIFRYNADKLPLPMQFVIYTLIGGVAAVVNLISFLAIQEFGVSLTTSAAVNYFLSIALLFHHKARWNAPGEVCMYLLVVALVGLLDVGVTRGFVAEGVQPWLAKSLASLVGLVFNFLGRRYAVFWLLMFPASACCKAEGERFLFRLRRDTCRAI